VGEPRETWRLDTLGLPGSGEKGVLRGGSGAGMLWRLSAAALVCLTVVVARQKGARSAPAAHDARDSGAPRSQTKL
jgi:hypothetical protein